MERTEFTRTEFYCCLIQRKTRQRRLAARHTGSPVSALQICMLAWARTLEPRMCCIWGAVHARAKLNYLYYQIAKICKITCRINVENARLRLRPDVVGAPAHQRSVILVVDGCAKKREASWKSTHTYVYNIWVGIYCQRMAWLYRYTSHHCVACFC